MSHIDPPTYTQNDALSISVLMRLMSSQTTTVAPEFPLYRVNGVAEAYMLAAIAYDVRRMRQLVVMSPPRHGWHLDPAVVALAVAEDADVAMLTDAVTTRALAEAMTRELAPYSGGVRTLRPGVTEPRPGQAVDPDQHPVTVIGYNGSSPQHCLCRIEQQVREGRDLVRVPNPGALSAEDIAQLRNTVNAERERNTRLAGELTKLRRDLTNAQADLTEEQKPLFADPHAQFRYDLFRAWLINTPESDREQWPLREWELGELFLDSIEEQQIVDRARVMRACVDVITGRHRTMKSRGSRKLHDYGPRKEDGAMPWRCSIASGPAAPRLMWWECGNELVELSVVAHHDDVRIA